MGKPNNLATIKMLEEARKQYLELLDKCLYNYGLYDTRVSNGDGTATITRATQTYKFTGNEDCSMNSYNTACVFMLAALGLPEGAFGRENIVSNVLPTAKTYGTDIAQGDMDFAISFGNTTADRIVIRVSSIEQTVEAYKEWLSKNNLYVEYKTASQYQYEDRVIENQPIRFLPLEGELDLYKEWRKGLNLVSSVTLNVDVDLNTGKFYTANGKIASNKIKVEVGKTYSFMCNSLSLYDKDGNYLRQPHWSPNDISYKYTCEADVGYIIVVKHGSDLMVNEGKTLYPYVNYNGGLLREKDVPIYYTTDTASPAQTIGGTWERLGSFTVGNNTIHAWERL